MKNIIIKKLKELEKEKNIKILFCVESGSRLWRMESKDSDYNVRFVYIRPKIDYLRINNQADVIEHNSEQDIDIVGFDIYKFVKLLLNSNPSVIEWFKSDITYIDDGETKKTLWKFIEKKFNPKAIYHHYKSMCKHNYMKYLKSSENMTHKKYLYCMRGAVNALIIKYFNVIPPTNFETSIWMMGDEHFNGNSPISQNVLDKIIEIIELKKEGFEQVKISKIHLFEKYIEDFL